MLLIYYNIAGLIKSMGLEYNRTEWKPFIGSSRRNLKVLLHNKNSFSSIVIGHSNTNERHSQRHGSFAVNY